MLDALGVRAAGVHEKDSSTSFPGSRRVRRHTNNRHSFSQGPRPGHVRRGQHATDECGGPCHRQPMSIRSRARRRLDAQKNYSGDIVTINVYYYMEEKGGVDEDSGVDAIKRYIWLLGWLYTCLLQSTCPLRCLLSSSSG